MRDDGMIGENIQGIRKQHGLTLTQLADEANISKSYLSNIERGINQNPSIEVLKRLANVLQVDLKSILRTNESYGESDNLNQELIELIEDLQGTVVNQQQMEEYRALIHYIKWKNITK